MYQIHETQPEQRVSSNCNKGIFRYTQLIFGIAPAAEIYQKEIEIALSGLPGVKNISDDIIIGGTNTDELLCRTEAVLKRLKEKNLTVNRNKCEFMKNELQYMGHTLSEKGISPDQLKIASIAAIRPPRNVAELRLFLGMVTYCSRFNPHFAAPGSQNAADYLSRSNPLPTKPTAHNRTERYVNTISNTQLPHALSLSSLQTETKRDPLLSLHIYWQFSNK